MLSHFCTLHSGNTSSRTDQPEKEKKDRRQHTQKTHKETTRDEKMKKTTTKYNKKKKHKTNNPSNSSTNTQHHIDSIKRHELCEKILFSDLNRFLPEWSVADHAFVCVYFVFCCSVRGFLDMVDRQRKAAISIYYFSQIRAMRIMHASSSLHGHAVPALPSTSCIGRLKKSGWSNEMWKNLKVGHFMTFNKLYW